MRRVLDVGCGEAPWRAELRKLRPNVDYVGIDPSDYVVARFGRSRNIHLGGFGDVAGLETSNRFDLIVCADVLLYVNDRDLRRGLAGIAERLAGVAYLEAFTTNDNIEGDLSQVHRRRPQTYDRAFKGAGLRRVGPHLYAGPTLLSRLTDFEGRWPEPAG